VAKVITTLFNASALINGVKFVETELGKVSEEVSDEVAALFAKIPGFELVVEEVKAAKAAKAAKADATSTAAAATTPAQS
jgi:hypothetical protein